MLKPYTVDHFVAWAYDLTLDNGEQWKVEEYFALFVEDYFAGVPENWLIVPEGNAKTTNLAGFEIYNLEFRELASIPWAASSRDQAEIGYRQAEGFVLRNERLQGFLKCQEGYRRIKNELTGGRMQVFAADANTGDGIIPTDAAIDELHRHRNLNLYRTWAGKRRKRNGQIAIISTAGEPGLEFEAAREALRQTLPVVEWRTGFIHGRSKNVALHEYAVAEDGDIEDMEQVKAANPASFITVADLAEKRLSETMTVAHWSRFTCNLATRGPNAAITEAEWFAARVEDEIPAGEPRWLGLDVAWKWDTTAMVPLWIRDPHYRLLGPATILSPPRDGTSLDPVLVEDAILEEHERGPIHTVVMDTTRAEQLASWIEDAIGATVVDRSQTNSFAAMDYERFTDALRLGWLKHTGDPGLTRHVLNAIRRTLPGDRERFDRPRESRNANQEARVIDALTAAAMVHTTAAAELDRPDEDRPTPLISFL